MNIFENINFYKLIVNEIFMNEYIKNPAKLKFDPLDKITRKEVREVFQDKLARTLWIGIKQRHLTDQYFESECLTCSEAIKKFGHPVTPGRLKIFLEKYFGMPCPDSESDFINELLPYLSGEKNLEYVVVK